MRWLRPATRQQHPEEIQPIRILTALVELDGYVAPTGQRITDILLRGQDLAFLPSGADTSPDNWIMVSPADILVVVPPPLPARPDWMDAVELTRVLVDVGPYRVMGNAHLRRGEYPDEQFRQQRPFLPLTKATIIHSGASDDVDVAIVSLAGSSQFGPIA